MPIVRWVCLMFWDYCIDVFIFGVYSLPQKNIRIIHISGASVRFNNENFVCCRQWMWKISFFLLLVVDAYSSTILHSIFLTRNLSKIHRCSGWRGDDANNLPESSPQLAEKTNQQHTVRKQKTHFLGLLPLRPLEVMFVRAICVEGTRKWKIWDQAWISI